MNERKPNNTAVNFLGIVVINQPETMAYLTPREGYILFAHSDQQNRRTFDELGDIFNISKVRAHQIYKKALIQTYERSCPQIQEQFPLTTIFESVSIRSPETKAKIASTLKVVLQTPEVKALKSATATNAWKDSDNLTRMSESQRKRWRDPEYRRRMKRLRNSKEYRDKLSASQTERFKDPEARLRISRTLKGKKRKGRFLKKYKIDSADQDLWIYALANHTLERIAQNHLLSNSEINILTDYFNGKGKSIRINHILDKFSILVARLQ